MKRACEGSRDVLGRTVACRMVENCRIGNGRFDPRQVNFRKKFEMRDHDHLRG